MCVAFDVIFVCLEAVVPCFHTIESGVSDEEWLEGLVKNKLSSVKYQWKSCRLERRGQRMCLIIKEQGNKHSLEKAQNRIADAFWEIFVVK